VGTWRDPDLGRPIAAPLEQCAELLDVDLATVRKLAAQVEPYVHADGTRIWSLMQLERQLRCYPWFLPLLRTERRPRGSNPPSDSSSGPGRRYEGAVTWRFSVPVVTARARRGPGVPGVMRTQRGPLVSVPFGRGRLRRSGATRDRIGRPARQADACRGQRRAIRSMKVRIHAQEGDLRPE
jgi:hypothetical protein